VLVIILAIMAAVDLSFEVTMRASGITITVDDDGGADYVKIQDAINASKNGDTVFVYSGIYYEHLIVNKEINLLGEDKETTIIDGGYKHNVIFVTSSNVVIKGLSIRKSGTRYSWCGIAISNQISGKEYPVNNIVIEDNILTNNHWGIRYVYGFDSVIRNNTFSNNLCGVRLDYGGSQSVIDNIFANNYAHGIFFGGINLSDITFTKNIVYGNGWGDPKWAGICGGGGINFTISDNIIFNNSIGVHLWSWVRNCTINNNTISDSEYGIYLKRVTHDPFPMTPFNTTIYHNNFINNTVEAYDDMLGYNNWHHQTLLEGNHWSKYNGLDDGSGSGKHSIAGDGIGDTKIPHPGSNYDFYPFIDENGWKKSPNRPPTANAGENQTVHLWETVYFDGSNSSDPEGDELTYEWDFGDGSLLGLEVNVTHDYNAIGIYFVTLKVTDSGGLSDTDTCVITVKYPPGSPPIPHSMELFEGWNLISFPTIQSNAKIKTLFQSIEGEYDGIQLYDATDSNDPWKHYKVSKEFGNDLLDVDETMGILVHIIKSGGSLFYFNGTQPVTTQTISLYKGWNLVGYPSLSNHNRTVGLNNLIFNQEVDAIQWFDSLTKSWHFMGPDDSFEIGRGYWIHAKSDCVWEVPL
jgi:parallel beta-helix repeat protein